HGLITVEGEKMSKSLGNFVVVDYLLNKFHPEVIRVFLLSKHYRSPLDYSEKNIKETEKAIYHLYETLYWLKKAIPQKEGLLSKKARDLERKFLEFEEKFESALLEDLNTALALGHLFKFENEVYNFITRNPFPTAEEVILLENIAQKIKDTAGKILGIGDTDPLIFWQEERTRKLQQKGINIEEIEKMILERQKARKEKNFTLADEIRNKLREMGIVLKDTRIETFWYVE
ncbi:MAG: cysteine--tRNA ligase, partial [Thermodesulfobacteriota bacterium]